MITLTKTSRTNGSQQVVEEILYRLNVGAAIQPEMITAGMTQLVNMEASPARDVQLGSFLFGFMARPASPLEIKALIKGALAIDSFDFAKRLSVDLPRKEKLVGIMGSGKKGIKTMNISTPSLLVAACDDVYCAKPVSSATSSVTGSSDFLADVGVNLKLDHSSMIDVIKRTHCGFFSIEDLIPQFDKSYGGKFYAPHALSFALPALLTPVKFDKMVYGLAHPNIELSATLLHDFGVRDGLVYTSTHDQVHFLDEMNILGHTSIIGIRNGTIGSKISFRPQMELRLPDYNVNQIKSAPSRHMNVKLAIDVLRGRGEPAREDLIALNASNLLFMADKCKDYIEGYHRAKQIIHSGEAYQKLVEVVRATGGNERELRKYL